MIVLSVDIFTLSHYDDIYSVSELDDFYNSQQFLPFIFNDKVQNYISEYKGFDFFDFHFPLIRYYGETKAIKEAFRSKKTTYYKDVFRTKGFRAVPRSWTKDFMNATSQISFYEVKIYAPYQQLMDDFLKECDRLGIEVVMVYTPEYIDGQRFVKNRVELLSIYKTMANEHQLKFIDYSDHQICRDRDMFYNSQHLNGKGARIFSQIFVGDLKRLNIIQ